VRRLEVSASTSHSTVFSTLISSCSKQSIKSYGIKAQIEPSSLWGQSGTEQRKMSHQINYLVASNALSHSGSGGNGSRSPGTPKEVLPKCLFDFAPAEVASERSI
jgi:hypothetical protein